MGAPERTLTRKRETIMAHPREICLDIGGRPITVHIRRETREQSLHTERELMELHGTVTTVDEATHEWLSECLPHLGDRVLSARDANGDRFGRWLISWNSYSVNAGAHTYSLIVREAEELSLEVLLLDGLELYPYEYREEVVGDGLAVWAKLVGTEDDVLRLRRLVSDRSVFPVIRRGISDTPREMRVGVAEWSHFEDRVKYRIALVDAHLRDSVAGEIVQMEEENNRSAFAFYANLVEQLTGRLIEKGLLGEEEVAELRESARAEPGVSRHEFWRVPDVDVL
jgi:hypothetical protein